MMTTSSSSSSSVVSERVMMAADGRNCCQLEQYKGWLYKWTNYIKGYQKRWFMLQNGYLSYYRNPAEVSNTCRGTINLANAFIHTQDSCSFVISSSGSLTFHLKANSEVERQSWVTQLELAKSKAITMIESDDDVTLTQPDRDELQNVLRTLNSKLEDIRICSDLIQKHGLSLQRALVELELTELAADAVAKMKPVNERATLFRITSSAMINTCGDFVKMAQEQGLRWQKLLQYEHEQRLYLEDMVEQLGKQHSNLEKQIRKSMNGAVSPTAHDTAEADDDDEDFYDAVDDDEKFSFKSTLFASEAASHRRMESGVSVDSLLPSSLLSTAAAADYESSDAETTEKSVIVDDCHIANVDKKKYRKACSSTDVCLPTSIKQPVSHTPSSSTSVIGDSEAVAMTTACHLRRQTIPERPNYSINLWSIMKNCIGKELSKIPMPVNFSEPLSFLQRLTEDFEYSDCLDNAAKCTNRFEQLAYVAAFAVSSYANTTVRTGKPFNPLLGETYECDRFDELGWRAFTEQVSHHPPTTAMYTEGRHWQSWQEFTMASKFRGKYLQIIPLGIAHLLFPSSNNHYTWRKVTTTVNNIIVGRLWVDNHGEMDIKNHTTGDNCHLKFFAYSYFSREPPRKVSGVVTDSAGVVRYVLSGTWDIKMEGATVLNADDANAGALDYITGPSKVLWQRRYPPAELEKCYNFTQLAIELNEMEDGVAPTDSRLRPDQRLMERGLWDEANACKVLLEEKQRAARRHRERQMEDDAAQGLEYRGYEPKWFAKQNDSLTGNIIHMFTHEYWQCKRKHDWTRCPDIFVDWSAAAAQQQ